MPACCLAMTFSPSFVSHNQAVWATAAGTDWVKSAIDVTSCTIHVQTNYSYLFWWHYSSEYEYTIRTIIRRQSEYEANIRYIPTHNTAARLSVTGRQGTDRHDKRRLPTGVFQNFRISGNLTQRESGGEANPGLIPCYSIRVTSWRILQTVTSHPSISKSEKSGDIRDIRWGRGRTWEVKRGKMSVVLHCLLISLRFSCYVLYYWILISMFQQHYFLYTFVIHK